MARVIVGTEIYLSDRFSDLWLKAAKKNCKYPIILFDNNPENKAESQIVKDKCRDMGIKYFRMIPRCLQCHSVDMLYWYAATNRFDYFVHLDIDCPPLLGVIEKVLEPVINGASAATDLGGAHCFACNVLDVIDMSAQRLPIYQGEKETRFSDEIPGGFNSSGRKVFDHCRWIFHDLEKRGLTVISEKVNVLHAKFPSYKNKNSNRYKESFDIEGLRDALRERHKEYWNHPEIMELMNG